MTSIEIFFIRVLKISLINFLTYFYTKKITNKISTKANIYKECIILIINILITVIVYSTSSYINGIIITIIGLTIIFSKITKSTFSYSIVSNIIGIGITYIVYFIAIIISFIISKIVNIQNYYINFIIITTLCLIETYLFNKIYKIKYGFSFLKNNLSDRYLDICILNLSAIILFCFFIFSNYEIIKINNFFYAFIIFSIIMFITIQKSLELYYKQKLQKRELEETREELKKVKEERNELQKENLKISKEKHSIVYNQEKLEYKINQLLLKNETSEELQIKDKIEEISNKIRNEDVTIELTKTGIEEIDDMLKYMQAKCKKNNINFELQVKGNIHHMINKYIEKKDLEILLADHIKNAIIAINYSKNINKSILVKLGIIDGVYSVYFYDTGTEFNKETLLNLGKKPSTTHADNGGTGMGFLNTFDKLKKYKASITINEYGKPCEDNYTKYIAIKFDNKNEYQIHSYRFAEIKLKI